LPVRMEVAMKICVPVESAEGLQAPLYDRFGSAPYFLLFELGQGVLTSINRGSPDRVRGMCEPVRELLDHAVDVVICKGINGHGIEMLARHGIRVYRTNAETAGEAVEDFRSGLPEGIGTPTSRFPSGHP